MSKLEQLWDEVMTLAPNSDRRAVERMGIREAEYALQRLGHRSDLDKISYQPSKDVILYLARGARGWLGMEVRRA